MNNDQTVIEAVRIEKEILTVADEIYGVVEDKIPKKELTSLINRAQTVLTEYDSLLSGLKGAKRESFLKLQFDVNQIRHNLKIIEAN